MIDPDELAALLSSARATATQASDYELDEHIAVWVAKARVARAHGLTETAAAFDDVVSTMADVRRERGALYTAAEDAMYPDAEV